MCERVCSEIERQWECPPQFIPGIKCVSSGRVSLPGCICQYFYTNKRNIFMYDICRTKKKAWKVQNVLHTAFHKVHTFFFFFFKGVRITTEFENVYMFTIKKIVSFQTFGVNGEISWNCVHLEARWSSDTDADRTFLTYPFHKVC